MMTTFDIVDAMWKHLSDSPLKDAVNGGIYKRRPLNSRAEDVVINAISASNTQLQQSLVNVNIHVPNLVHGLNGHQDTGQPDTVRMKELAAIAVAALSDQWEGDFHFDVQQQVLFEDASLQEHYINIRVDFFSINVN